MDHTAASLALLSDEDLLVLWDEATARAEEFDDWTEVEVVETEVNRRGLDG